MARAKARVKPLLAKLPLQTLVMYKGGGYDGCIFEWNYAYIDDTGKYHEIYTTGSLGCHSRKELTDRYHESPDDVEMFRMQLAQSRARLVDTVPLSHLLKIAVWFHAEQSGIRLSRKCDGCNQLISDLGEEEAAWGDGVYSTKSGHTEYGSLVCGTCFREQQED